MAPQLDFTHPGVSFHSPDIPFYSGICSLHMKQRPLTVVAQCIDTALGCTISCIEGVPC